MIKSAKTVLAALAVTAVSSTLLCTSAQALTGGISFSGDYVPRDAAGNPVTSLALATQIQFGNTGSLDPAGPSVVNGTSTGSFAAVPNGTPVQYGTPVAGVFPTTFTLNLAAPGLPINPYFTIGAPAQFTFRLNTLATALGTFGTLDIAGTGIFNNASGTDPSNGTYVATFNTTQGTFSYSASAGATPIGVPDGGSAVALLGMALVGVEALRRKLSI